MELLEAEPAQIEHFNQVLYNNRQHDSWDCFDTYLLLEQFPEYGRFVENNITSTLVSKDVVDVRYNSMIVNIKHETESTIYTFEIRNSLWDGTYKIQHSKANSTDTDVNFSDSEIFVSVPDETGNTITFTVSGAYRNRVRICFHMNVAGDGRNIQTSTIHLDNPSEYTHQFDESVKEKGYIYSSNGSKISGAKITLQPCDSNGIIISKGIPNQTILPAKQKNGEFVMTYGKTSAPGDYYCLLKASYKNTTTSQIIHVIKTQKQKVVIEWKPLPKEVDAYWGDETQYRKVIKGSIKTYHIGIEIKNEFGNLNTDSEYLENAYATVTMKKVTGGTTSQTVPVKKSNNEYYIEPTVSYRGYYENKSMLQISMPSVNGYPAITKERVITHAWKTVSSFKELSTETSSENGADWIFLKPGTITFTSTLTLKPRQDGSKLTLAGTAGTSNCTLKGNDSINLININNQSAATDNYFKVQLIGLTLRNGSPAVKMTTGCRLLVDNCYFTNNNHKKNNHRGCSIFMPSTDKSKATHNLWKLEVRNSTFYNNKGNEIQSIGKTYIHNNLFKTDNKAYLQQPEVKVVSVKAGEVTYKYNKSYINIPQVMASNHSYAKALAYIDKKGKFNGKGPSQLKRNNSLPLFGDKWHNEAYTRAVYYYPYSNVRTTIVCSPERGKERRATGHSSSAKNWVYYDGYYFLRYNKGKNKGNTRNPWTKKELALPGNQGIYSIASGHFIKKYDPRTSGNNSLNSQLD